MRHTEPPDIYVWNGAEGHPVPPRGRAWPVHAVAVALAVGSSGFGGAAPPPAGVLARYDFGAPPAQRWELPKLLGEISGLALDRTGRLFAHDDERAIIYQLDVAAERIVKRFAFGRPAVRDDFEAIAIMGDRFFLTNSNGVLYEGREGSDGTAVPFVARKTGLGARCEIEGLALDREDGWVLLACKMPRTASLQHAVTVYRWSAGRHALGSTPRLLVPLPQVTRALGTERFHPSDIVRDPASGHMLLLSGLERAIVELDAKGAIVGVARLRPKLHRQPEGLAMAADGSLLVSDEAAGRSATLTVYRRVR